EDDRRPVQQHDVRRVYQRLVLTRLEELDRGIEVGRLLDPERPDSRAAQLREVPTDAQLLSEVVGQRAYVEALATLDIEDHEGTRRPPVAHLNHVERVDDDGPRLELVWLASARGLVRRHALALHGA